MDELFRHSGTKSEVSITSALIKLFCNVIEQPKILTQPQSVITLAQRLALASGRILACERLRFFWLGSLLAPTLVIVLFLQPSYADQRDETFLVYAVNIDMRSWRGNGIYIGKGLFLTAAHVVGRSWLTKPEIVIGGQKYPTRVVKEGSSSGTDLTLLAVDERLLPMRLRLRKNPLCTAPPWPGQEVVTVAPEAVVHSHIISPARLPPNLRNRTSLIGDVASTGNSGSGVFDARQKCLLGIMSQKISQSRTRATGEVELHDIAKYFVPASTIDNFIPADLRSLTAQ